MRMTLVTTLLVSVTACAPTNKKDTKNNSSMQPAPSSIESGELADDTKIYGLNSKLNFVINRDIKQSSLNYFQDNRWTSKPIWTKDYCAFGGAGPSINEKSGATDRVVFIKSTPEGAKSIRIGLPGDQIRTFVLVECALQTISKDSTYGQLKNLTGNLFRLERPSNQPSP
jgi:hypothetical protein